MPDASADPQADDAGATTARLIELSLSYRRTVWCMLLVYAADLLFRACALALEGSAFLDIPEQHGCGGRRDRRLLCSGFVRLWTLIEIGIVMPKVLLMVLSFGVLCCCFAKSGGISEIVDDVRKFQMLQQIFTFLSSIFFAVYFATLHDYLSEDAKKIYWIVLFVSLLPFLFADCGRRRCQSIYRKSELLMEQARALSRADSLPRMAFRDYLQTPLQLNSTSSQEASCAICLSAFEAEAIVSNLPCQHVFHHECVRQWFMRGLHTGCPMRCSDSAEPALTALGVMTQTSERRPIETV